MNLFDVLIVGASASGLMCAIEAAKRGRKVIVLDHASKAGKKHCGLLNVVSEVLALRMRLI